MTWDKKIEVNWTDLTENDNSLPDGIAPQAFITSPPSGRLPSQGLPETMKANRQIAGQKCPLCLSAIALGHDIHNCSPCRLSYHEECWNENMGCATYGCPQGPSAKSKMGSPDFRVQDNPIANPQPVQKSLPSTTSPPQGLNSLTIFGWIMFVLGVFTILTPIGWIIILSTSLIVGIDAANLNLGVLRRSGLPLTTLERHAPRDWALDCLFMWIGYFPAYLVKRAIMARAAQQTIRKKLYLSAAEETATHKKVSWAFHSTALRIILLIAMASLVGTTIHRSFADAKGAALAQNERDTLFQSVIISTLMALDRKEIDEHSLAGTKVMARARQIFDSKDTFDANNWITLMSDPEAVDRYLETMMRQDNMNAMLERMQDDEYQRKLAEEYWEGKLEMGHSPNMPLPQY